MSALPDLPDEALDRPVLVPLREYLSLLDEVKNGGPMVVDSAWLVERLGMSQDWWAERARVGDVDAFQETKGSPWRFDRASCMAHLLRLKNNSPGKRVKRRGPWQEKGAA